MKKKLLLLGAVVLTSMASFAQGWVAPTYTPQEFVTSTEGSDTTFFYLYNVEAKAFFTAANDWQTRASLGTPPQRFYFTENADGSYLMHNWVLRDNMGWKLLFIDSETSMFVDRGNQADYFWSFDFLEGNVMRIYGADVNPTYNQEGYGYTSYMGFDSYEGLEVRVLTPFLDIEDVIEDHEYMVDWILVSPEEYDEIADKALAYDAAMALKAALEEAEDMYTEINLAGMKAVYNNTNSTAAELDSVRATLAAAVNLVEYIYTEVEPLYPTVSTDAAFALIAKASYSTAEVQAAYDAVYTACRNIEVYEILDGATADDPRDATSLLTNSDFETGNTDGWILNYTRGTNVTNLGYQGGTDYYNGDVTVSHFIEAWANSAFNSLYSYRALGVGSVYQTLKGLPGGKYTFSVDAISSNQDGHGEQGAYLFAKNGDLLFTQTIATGNGLPEHFEVTFVTTGGDIDFGFMTDETCTVNWMACDNFELMYYGEVEDDPYKVVLDGLIDSYNQEFPDYGEDALAFKDIKDAYKAEVQKAEGLTEGFQEEMITLADAYKALKASIADYEGFAKLIAENEAKQIAFEETYPDLSGLLEDMRMEWEDAYSDCTADADYIAAAKAEMVKTIIDYITDNIKPGSDITALINNPSFDVDFSGWQSTGSRPAWGGTKALQDGTWYPDDYTIESGNAEVYHAAFDMYQWIYNLPKGSYTFTCQAFERNDDGWEAFYAEGPEAGINCVLYAGGFETKVCNLAAFASEEEYYSGGQWYDDTYSSYGYVANGMTGANYHFAANPENYLNKVNVTIPEDGDSVRIGIKISTANSWVIFDNFRMIYNGAGVAAYEEAIDDQIAKLEKVFDDAMYYGTDAQAKVNEAITALAAAKAGVDPDACVAALLEGKEAYTYASNSMSAYTKLYNSYDELYMMSEEYAEIAPEAYDQACNLIEKIENGIDDGAFTVAEIEEIQKEIDAVMAAFKQAEAESYYTDVEDDLPAGYESATEEDPVDFTDLILDADFDDPDGYGWDWGEAGVTYDSKNVSSGADNTGNPVGETYAGWGACLADYTFDVFQGFVNMPNGYYKLACQGYARPGDNGTYDETTPHYVELYANEVSVPLKNIAADPDPDCTDTAVTLSDGETVVYVPNGTVTASMAFVNGYYGNSLIVKVTNGKLRIGIRKTFAQGVLRAWTCFDNFSLTYLGTEVPTSINAVENAQPVVAGTIYNIAGQKLAAPVKGINIINGKKILVK